MPGTKRDTGDSGAKPEAMPGTQALAADRLLAHLGTRAGEGAPAPGADGCLRLESPDLRAVISPRGEAHIYALRDGHMVALGCAERPAGGTYAWLSLARDLGPLPSTGPRPICRREDAARALLALSALAGPEGPHPIAGAAWPPDPAGDDVIDLVGGDAGADPDDAGDPDDPDNRADEGEGPPPRQDWEGA